MAAGTLNRATTRQSACLAIKPNLKMLLAKCTAAVAAIASGTGKNSANTGTRTVSRPKPEKSVRSGRDTNQDKFHVGLYQIIEFRYRISIIMN